LTKNNIIISNNYRINNLYSPSRAQRAGLARSARPKIYKSIGLRYYSTGRALGTKDPALMMLIKESIFNILIFKSNKHKLGEGISLSFTVNHKDIKELDKLYNMFNKCGKIVKRKNYFSYIILDTKSINSIVIPFLLNCNFNSNKFKV
jgi:LAGLIDADG DNA endonuclease family protein